MSNCVKELYDYDLFRKCSKCGIICLKSKFNKKKNMSDGLYKQCKPCKKRYYNKNQEKTKINI